jgi:hypothetical protein
MIKLILSVFSALLFSFVAHAQLSWQVSGNNVSSDAKLGTNTGHDLIIETNNLERFRVTDDGKFGIGLSNPDTKLHVLGNFKLQGDLMLPNLADANADDVRLLYIDQQGQLQRLIGSGWLIKGMYQSDCRTDFGDPYPAPVWKSTGGADFGVLYTGLGCPARVGIGTDAPIALLDVDGRARIKGELHIGGDALYNPAMRLRITHSDNTQPTPLMDLNGDGRLALYTYNPDPYTCMSYSSPALTHPFFSLSAFGQMELRYTTLNNWADPFSIKLNDSEDVLSRVNHNGTWDFNYFGTDPNGLLMTFTNKTTAKNVYALTGDGKVWCQGLWVKSAPFWGDFVFSKGYKLRPLAEVKEYIDTNGRLPEMPSAQEVEEKGVDVYELLRLLNIKIEELTLYSIEQQEQIAALKAQLDAIQK